jgi:hypothetical protein
MSKKNLPVFLLGLCCFSIPIFAQSNELSFSVGGVLPTDQKASTVTPALCPVINCNIITNNFANSSGVAFMGNFSRRITFFGPASLYLEAPVVGGPGRDTTVTSRTGQVLANIVTLSSSSLFFTPSAMVKFRSSSRISPFATLGGGLAHLGTTSGTKNASALQFGGGLELNSPIPHLGFRTEVRDFFSGSAFQSTNLVSVSPSHQHMLFVGGGAVFKF